MATIYYDQDANLAVVKDKTVAIIGYGNQGRSQALNMRDSGLKHIIVGSVRDTSWEKARQDGFDAYPIEEASRPTLSSCCCRTKSHPPSLTRRLLQIWKKETSLISPPDITSLTDTLTCRKILMSSWSHQG